MIDKDPTGTGWLTLLWFVLLSAVGGLVSFIQNLNRRTEPLPLLSVFLHLLGDLVVSGFAGVITFYLCQFWQLEPTLTAVMVAISGHMGGRAINKLEQMYDSFLKLHK